MAAEPIQTPPILNYPGVFERITEPDKHWLYTIKAFQLNEISDDDSPALGKWLEEDEKNTRTFSRRRRSFLTQEWADALLTFPGTVWFVAQATALGVERVARLCRYGMPWPLLADGFDGIVLYFCNALSTEQQSYLQQLFDRPHDVTKTLGELSGMEYREAFPGERKHIPSNRDVNELEYYTRMSRYLGVEFDEAKRICPPLVSMARSEEVPPGFGTHELARARWEQTANLSGESVQSVHQVARGLCCYLDCLVSYICECHTNRTKGGMPLL